MTGSFSPDGAVDRDRGEREQRPGIDGHGHFRLGFGLGAEVEGVGRIWRPIAGRLHYLLEARQVVLGAPPQRRIARRRLVLELHQLRRRFEVGEQLLVLEPLELDLDLVGRIGPGRRGKATGEQGDKEQETYGRTRHLLPNARRGRSLRQKAVRPGGRWLG